MKTDLTRMAEKCLWHHTNKMGTFGCFEVTLGFGGDERVDFMTYETDNTIRCYEIKVTMADLKSEAALTFVGDYNYLVVTEDLWAAICEDDNLAWKLYGAGMYVFSPDAPRPTLRNVKKARKCNVDMGTRCTVLESMIRSLNREVSKFYEIAPFWEIAEPV